MIGLNEFLRDLPINSICSKNNFRRNCTVSYRRKFLIIQMQCNGMNISHCIQVNDVIRVYYAIRKEDGVLYWLGATKGAPEPLSEDEEANILWLAGDGPLPPSKAVRRPDGELDFTSGPLKRLAELEALRSVLVRERRATAVLPLHGIEHKIRLSFELEQETGSSDGAGSPPRAKAADIL